MGGIDRRAFLRRGIAAAGGLSVCAPLLAMAACSDGPEDFVADRSLVDMGDLMLPEGFHYRVLSRQDEMMSDGHLTPSNFDGMAAVQGPHGGTILIRNHENRAGSRTPVVVPPEKRYDPHPFMTGGCTKLVVDANRRLIDSYAVLGGTTMNCAGGQTPWGSWISCEETFDDGDRPHGYAFEVDANSTEAAVPLPIRAAGRLRHEAVAWLDGVLYETEDRPNGAFYRVLFDDSPKRPGDLAAARGRLQALRVRADPQARTSDDWPVGEPFVVDWVDLADPEPTDDSLRKEARDRGAAIFNRPEGAWVGKSNVYFSCTEGGRAGMGQVWEFDPAFQALTLVYESPGSHQLDHPDNIVVGRKKDLFLCEDNDSIVHIRRLAAEGRISTFAEPVTNSSEFCGACFDPARVTLFVNQQGSAKEDGVTFAIWGPWDSL